MEKLDFPERLSALETNEKNLFHRIDELKEDVCEIHHVTVLCETIAARLEHAKEQLSALDSRLSALEHAPAEDLRHYKRTAISYAARSVSGILFDREERKNEKSV